MENVRNRVNINILRAPEERQNIIKREAQPSFKRFTIFGDGQLDLDSEVIDDAAWAIPGVDGDVEPQKSCVVGIHNRKTEVHLCKPLYLGMAILDTAISRHCMVATFGCATQTRTPSSSVSNQMMCMLTWQIISNIMTPQTIRPTIHSARPLTRRRLVLSKMNSAAR